MRILAAVILVLGIGGVAAAQERPVPSDSSRVTLSGCARKSVFTVRWRDDHEPITGEVAEGRRFRMTGRKEVLNEIKKREGSMVEITGLVRKNALNPQQGIAVGRVRIGIGSPQAPVGDPARNPEMYQPILDVESYQLLPENCPTK
jgi:hypothetical protein